MTLKVDNSDQLPDNIPILGDPFDGNNQVVGKECDMSSVKNFCGDP
jgi:hypothetical protein